MNLLRFTYLFTPAFLLVCKAMEQLILWFNIMGFTLLFASLGAAYVIYGRKKPGWLFHYLLYLAVYAFFTIFNTYGFFSQVYLPPMSPFFNYLAMYITFGIALILLIVVPRFIFSLFSSKQSLKQKIFTFGIAGLFLIMMIIAILYPEWYLNSAGAGLMNGYLGFVTLYGIIRIRRSGEQVDYGVVIPFLYLSCIFYFIVVVQSIILPLVSTPLQNEHISLFTAGLICFLWGAITLIYMIIKNYSHVSPGTAVLTEDYASRYGITPREKEIIILLLQGKSNKEISETLFVSHRTVEAHIYNIYRKCSVKNKLELSHHIASNS